MAESGEYQGNRRNEIYGVLWPPTVNQEALDALRDYDIRDDDVIVVSYPKSGIGSFIVLCYPDIFLYN